MDKDDGGSAFPEVFTDFHANDGQHGRHDTYSAGGMSLRDYFAAHAPSMTEQWFKGSGGKAHWLEAEAAWRFAYADAMLKERTSK